MTQKLDAIIFEIAKCIEKIKMTHGLILKFWEEETHAMCILLGHWKIFSMGK